MNIPSDYREIIEMLADASEHDRVKWNATQFTIDVVISGSKFSLWGGNDIKSKRGFVALELRDQAGQKLDVWAVDENDADYELMKNLYASAKRKTLKIPQRLALVREEIRNSEMIGAISVNSHVM